MVPDQFGMQQESVLLTPLRGAFTVVGSPIPVRYKYYDFLLMFFSFPIARERRPSPTLTSTPVQVGAQPKRGFAARFVDHLKKNADHIIKKPFFFSSTWYRMFFGFQ